MMNDKSSRPNREEDGSMESFLENYGELWTESSVSDSQDLTNRFRERLSREPDPETNRSPESRGWWHPGWIVATAACALVLLLAPGYWNRTVGEIVFSSGQVRVNRDASNETPLEAGTRIQTAEGGEAMVSLDDGRIDLFLREGTELDLAAADKVSLSKGDLWVRVDPDSGHFEVKTPQGSVTVHGTTFGVRVHGEGTQVEIASGKVSVGNSMGTEFIEPGTGARISGPGVAPAVHASSGDVTPGWARDIFKDASAARARRFFPSAAP